MNFQTCHKWSGWEVTASKTLKLLLMEWEVVTASKPLNLLLRTFNSAANGVE